jgi:hypothetical protein
MIPKSTMVLAAALILGSSLGVHAYQLDANTGLPTEYYYGPVCDHVKQGLPVREGKSGCTNQASAKQPTSAKRGSHVRLLEDRPHAVPVSSDDKHKPW